MNTRIKTTLINAEGRWLTDSEAQIIRDYARDMPERARRCRRLEQAEGRIVAAVLAQLPSLSRRRPDRALEQGLDEDLRALLRRIAAAHLNDALVEFDEGWAALVAELFGAVEDVELLASFYACVEPELRATLDARDAEHFIPYTRAFCARLEATR